VFKKISSKGEIRETLTATR